jgi:hypothetical protein
MQINADDCRPSVAPHLDTGSNPRRGECDDPARRHVPRCRVAAATAGRRWQAGTGSHWPKGARPVQRLVTVAHLWPDSDERTRDAVDLVLRSAADYLRTADDVEGQSSSSET